ncbi:receptor-like protein 18 [Quercus lobata]|uniref:receptor-like protein 18 n=1 Tax=Quercus lobata TaxID=97700 RepID=UPI001247F581|nr:receptor-like protein 18 [Quercus lobata]
MLVLSQNSLTEAIPSVLFTTPSLSTLYLDQNQLTGPLKFQNISSSPLNDLRLSGNKLNESIPRSIANLTKLQRLYLSSINLKGKVELEIFFELKELQDLDLSGNKVLVPKANINSTLPKFSSLSMSSCNLTEFPNFLKAQNELQGLDLSNNNIEVLAMKNNHFQGNLPETFINGCSLRTLDLNNNTIQGKIPRSLVKCPMLEVLNLGNNKLNDTFPFWLESLPELKILVLRANGLHGPVWDPDIQFGLSKLHVVDLSHNNFSGKLPSDYFQNWRAISKVTSNDKSQPGYMGDDSNYYKDSMTVVNKGVELELVKILTIFTAIDLSDNRFYGEIPDSVGNLKGLIVLNLSCNKFMSHIPSSLGNIIVLESLDLSQNSLFGEMPQ